jgi:hypothetical protein
VRRAIADCWFACQGHSSLKGFRAVTNAGRTAVLCPPRLIALSVGMATCGRSAPPCVRSARSDARSTLSCYELLASSWTKPPPARARQTGPAEAISTPTPTTELPTAPHLQHPCQTDTDQSSDIMADDKFYRVLGVSKVRRHRVGGPRPGGATKVVRGRSRARGRVFVIRLASKRRRLIAMI